MKMKKSPRVKWLVEKVEGRKILDVGFIGSYSKPLLHILISESNKGSLIVGLDINKIGIHKHQIPDSLVGDSVSLPFKESSFDTVILAEVIEHFWVFSGLIEEVFRVLESEGRFYLTTPNPYSFNRLFRNWLTARNPSDKRNYKRFLGDRDHKLFYDPLSLCNYLDNSGFEVIELTTKNFKFPFIRVLLNLNSFPFNRLGGYTCILAQKRCPH